jgi:ABC-type multidrug transport system fused ATPase/permease subunit
MKSVYDLTKELTIIIVAHRISSLEGVSRLIELDNGRIIEQ